MRILKVTAAASLLLLGTAVVQGEVVLNCDPCIERSSYKLAAFYHGPSSDPFWQEVAAAATQSALDFGVALTITMYDTYDPTTMAADITAEAAKRGEDRPNALIVTMPDEAVEVAVAGVIAAGIPVFGLNAGYTRAQELGAVAWVAQDEYQAGWDAAAQFVLAAQEEAQNPGGSGNSTDSSTGDGNSTSGGLGDVYVCNICGVGFESTTPDAVVTIPTQPDRTCGELMAAAEIGNINESNCGLLLGFSAPACGCVASTGEMTTVTTSPTEPPSSSNETMTNETFSAVRQADGALLALFINPEEGNLGREERFMGFRDHLALVNVTAEQIYVNSTLNTTDLTNVITEALDGCPYSLILLGSGTLLDAVPEGTCSGQSLMGTFGTSSAIYSAIAAGSLVFGSSQQQFLQGVLPVLFAVTYVTTGRIPATPLRGDYGAYLSGGFINKGNVPDAKQQTCLTDAFPVCPNTLAASGSESTCKCTNRSSITIGGVLHGVTTDSFWDSVFAAAKTSADDMGVTLLLERFDPEEIDQVLHLKMSNKMKSLCSGSPPVDGLFVTIPSDAVLEAIKECKAAGIPVISINAGAEVSQELGLLQHIGQLEYNAGFGAGKQLIEAGATKGWCMNHEPGTQTIAQRCEGMEAAFAEVDTAEYMGQIVVPRDDDAQYKVDVETGVNDDGLWDGFGLLLAGQIQLVPAITLLDEHPKVILGSFDLSEAFFAALNAKQVVFGIDQQPYLQGFLPIPLLTYAARAYAQQGLSNSVIESGPSFMLASPTIEQQTCESNFYAVCGSGADMTEPPVTTQPPAGGGDSGGGGAGASGGGEKSARYWASSVTARVLCVLTIVFFMA
jgi:simple sugar transport system substrate-binding protein